MRVDRHLSERGMREAMSRLYAAMVLSEANTEALRNGEAGRGSVEAVGSPTAVSCMNGLGWWLNTLRMYAEPDPFVDAIEAPLRRSAEFLQHMRTLRPRRSTDIRALVFAVSDPYYDYASDRDLRTVSAVAPDLENVVYVRMDDWGGGDVPGWYVFTGVQPILLVNRLRMTRGSSVTPAGTARGRGRTGGHGLPQLSALRRERLQKVPRHGELLRGAQLAEGRNAHAGRAAGAPRPRVER